MEIAVLLTEGSLRRRLLDIGFVEGTVLHRLYDSPFGDPTAYEVRGAVMALRTTDAARILVRNVDEVYENKQETDGGKAV